MLRAPIPENDQARLRALWAYKVLDTAPESSFDDIVKLASLFCETPTALISLVDEQRQWFKARVGCADSETARDISFCGHAILKQEIMVVPDASQDPRFSDNPMVTGKPYIKFYAGAPLITPSGFSIGTLCVIDSQPKQILPEQKAVLEILARILMRELENRNTLLESQEHIRAFQKVSKAMEEQKERLLFAEKMKSLGQMAGGIAHEINNPLTLIRSLSNTMRTRIMGGEMAADELVKRLDAIDQTVGRMAEIVKSMLLFSFDGRVDHISTYRTTQIIESAVGLIRGTLPRHGITLRLDPCEEYDVQCSIPMTLQILSNFLINAQEALEDDKESWISIGARLNDETGQVEFYVRDSGSGVAADLRTRIMEPFFTTKAPGKGTGLGLSISTSLAKAQGGDIYLDESSQHTCFVLALPQAVTQDKAQIS